MAEGYDPQQVAAFAAEALGWKRDLATCRSELQTAMLALDRYESVIGSIEEVEREAASLTEDAERRAAEIVRRAEDEAARILEAAQANTDTAKANAHDEPTRKGEPESTATASTDVWLTPSVEETPDPIEDIFEEFADDEELDSETEREKRVAAAAASLWKRRGVLSRPE